MFNDINGLENGIGFFTLNKSDNIMDTILGKPVEGVVVEHMMLFWEIICKHVYKSNEVTARNWVNSEHAPCTANAQHLSSKTFFWG